MTEPTVTIFARWPEAGKAKTRLIPALGGEGATAVYRKLLQHTVSTAQESGLPVQLRVTGAGKEAFQDWLGAGIEVVDQGEGELGAKLARVPAPAILVGSDCPMLDAALLRRAAEHLRDVPAVVGPANDGGYYLLGIARPMPFLFDDMAWSTADVLPETLRRLERNGIAPAMLEPLDDIDTPEDLARYPEFAV
ncbi:TIGR04282 family arsenosugar biosynthesis glycosyltransferase [Erythrobacter sp. W53]|uniref:TIGR04282 family arsenosugar biosynthesis glycosyltransferase n=1 Tax=Erythrobacter sp. W53 TaxID=3425947 RepID=UPI003D769612